MPNPHLYSVDDLRAAGALDMPDWFRKSLSSPKKKQSNQRTLMFDDDEAAPKQPPPAPDDAEGD